MSEYINWVTFIRNLIVSVIFGLLIPFLIYRYIDEYIVTIGITINYVLMVINGVIFVVVYTAFGFFRKETMIRFLIGCGYIGVIVYFYTVGYTIFTLYMPHCGFGYLCISGEYEGLVMTIGWSWIYVGIIVIILKAVNLFRHLIKPPDESKTKTRILKKVHLRD